MFEYIKMAMPFTKIPEAHRKEIISILQYAETNCIMLRKSCIEEEYLSLVLDVIQKLPTGPAQYAK